MNALYLYLAAAGGAIVGFITFALCRINKP